MKPGDRPCYVIGGGVVAARKCEALLKSGARVRVIAPEIGNEMAKLLSHPELRWRQKEFEETDLAGGALVIAATNRSEVNTKVFRWCHDHFIPVNVVDQPELCTFFMPAVIDRFPVQVAVSTGGAFPILARWLRDRIDSWLPPGIGLLAALAERFRSEVKDQVSGSDSRRRIWEELLDGPWAQMALQGQEEQAVKYLEETLSGKNGTPGLGKVLLVGAGPGDPELLTLKALRAMQKADVIVYDRLVSSEILEHCRRDALRIYAGKAPGEHTMSQAEISDLLVRLAREGKHVVRLKGGDPLVFGRAGEEMAHLSENGIPFEVIPGITAALGCAASARIPITHRDYAQTLVFVTGHQAEGELSLNWKALAQPDQTLAVYMGLSNLGVLREKLIEYGMPANTPVALIQQGTTPRQKIVSGILDEMPKLGEQSRLASPVLAIIGQVAKLTHESRTLRSA